MKSTNWRKTAPTLIFLVGTLAAALYRGREDPELLLNLLLFVTVPIILIGAVAYWVIELGRRAKSGQTWRVMEQRHPDEIKYLFPVFPHTRRDLERLGLPTRPAYLTFPVIGVVFGADVTLWEEGKIEPSLRIPYSSIEGVELASTENGARNWPAIRLLLTDHTRAGHADETDQVPQRGVLVLVFQDRGHKKLSQAERTNLVQELNSRLVRV